MARQFVAAINRHGGKATLVHLPEIGITGNSHFLMGEKNNAQLAGLMADWLREIGQRHGKSVAQITLRWLNQRGIAAIPKSVLPARMAENRAIFDFTLSADDMAAIARLGGEVGLFINHRDPATVKWLCEWALEGAG